MDDLKVETHDPEQPQQHFQLDLDKAFTEHGHGKMHAQQNPKGLKWEIYLQNNSEV